MIAVDVTRHDNEARHTPTADVLPYTVVELSDGRAGFHDGNNVMDADVEGRVRTIGLIELPCDSALVIPDGAEVHIASGAVALSGGFVVGKARRGGSPDGYTTVVVALNAPV